MGGVGATIDEFNRFNAGGIVSNNTSNTNASHNYGPVSVTINSASNVDAKHLARFVTGELDEIHRREGRSRK